MILRMRSFTTDKPMNPQNARLLPLKHSSVSVVVEDQPLEVARMRTGKEPWNFVIVHPRHAHGVSHDIVPLTGLRRGRGVGIVLDEPFVSGSKVIEVIDKKAVGADSTGDYAKDVGMLADLGLGPVLPSIPGPRRLPNSAWGVMDLDLAYYEASNVFGFGLPFVNHLGVSELPARVVQNILADSHQSVPEIGLELPRLAQITRVIPNTVRIQDILGIYSFLDLRSHLGPLDISALAKMDANLVQRQAALIARGSYLHYNSVIDDNRYADGQWTDVSNAMIRSKSDGQMDYYGPKLVRNVLDSMQRFISYIGGRTLGESYMQIVQEHLGGPWTNLVRPWTPQ